MFIETLVLENFKCFGPGRTTIDLGPDLTAFIGTNGSGKTAACEALLRLFGVTGRERAVRTEDFHVPAEETEAPASRDLTIEAVLAFPELDEDDQHAGGTDAAGEAADAQGDVDYGDAGDEEIDEEDLDRDENVQASQQRIVSSRAVPEFFSRMAAEDDGELKVRIVLKATWEDDGTVEGTIMESRIVVNTLAEAYGDDDYAPLPPSERSRIQMIYIPASRDGARQVTAFLGSRLWRAAQWSADLRKMVSEHAADVAGQFAAEPVVKAVVGVLGSRWRQLHDAGTHAVPRLRLLDDDFDQLVRDTELIFEPDPAGRARPARLLSDGQRSLLHLALAATTLDVEAAVCDRRHDADFTLDAAQLPNLTLVGVEEPENSVSPFFLSRIVSQLQDLAAGGAAQAVLSSHSAGVLTRIGPEDLRYFRCDRTTATSSVRRIALPGDDTEAGKYVREAADGIPCPAANDPARNRHRCGIAWAKSAVRVIVTNPRYTGRQVWNKQRKDEVLIDVDDVALGHMTKMRWNRSDKWIWSEKPTHKQLVSDEDFEKAQAVLAGRGRGPATHRPHPTRRPYAYRGVLFCGYCDRRMQGNWNNDQAYYRCRFPAEYALANRVDHPKLVYLREAEIIDEVDDWIAQIFRPAALEMTIGALAEQSHDAGDAAAVMLKEKITDCDRRLARYRAALDAGADPLEVTRWINDAKAERTRAEGERRALGTSRRMTREEISTVLAELGDLACVVVQAEAADKSKLYRELGLKLTYRPQKQTVEATVTPGLDMCKRLVSEGGLEPPCPVKGTSTSS